MDNPDWDVRRVGGTVRVNLARATYLTAADAEAIVAATEELLSDGEASIVEVDGPIDAVAPPDGLARALKSLHLLTERLNSQLIVASL